MNEGRVGTCEYCSKRTARVTKHCNGKRIHLCMTCNEGFVAAETPPDKIVALVEQAKAARGAK